jgi:hypothetical protein
MKINNTIRIKKPAVSEVHTLAVRVNFTADSGGAVSGTDASGGCSGETDGSLLMLSSLPVTGSNGTEPPGNLGRRDAGAG